MKSTLNADSIRADFPILEVSVNGKPLVYLDNGATTQKPRPVIDALKHFYETENSNIHRGVHQLSVQATDAYHGARNTVQKFLNAPEAREIIFTRGTTEGINLVAHSFVAPSLKEGDEILVSVMEHHANIVPWQLIAEPVGAKIVVIPMSDDGVLDQKAYADLLSERTKIAAFTHVSNALGSVNPVKAMTQLAKQKGIPVLIDGAQAVSHGPVDLQDIGCDFYVFSGHKLFGPDGIGVLFGHADLLNAMPPYQGGGDMIERVSFEKTSFREVPERFEAGTPHISGAIGLAAAIDYLDGIGWEAIIKHENELVSTAAAALRGLNGVRLIGDAPDRSGVVSFLMDEAHPHDIGTILDSDGIAIRSGHHCAQPLMQRLGIPGTARASFSFYNSLEEIDRLTAGIKKVQNLFG